MKVYHKDKYIFGIGKMCKHNSGVIKLMYMPYIYTLQQGWSNISVHMKSCFCTNVYGLVSLDVYKRVEWQV